ncbi:hypothetical protein ABC304_14745 [Microbacterium sp. 1P10UB]|uniref:hypothetical protein n=1 Tax=unclassified Microbacterium TaxID=2609290 RepID=UPI00399FD7EE
MRSRLSLIVAVSTLAAALLSGCTGEPAPVASTPTFATEDEAFAAAEQTYRNYVDALNQVDLSDPATFEPVYAWTTGDANAADRKSFASLHADGVTVDGKTSVSLMQGTGFTADPPAFTLAVCLDVSDVRLSNPDGSSAVPSDRPDLQSRDVLMEGSQESPTGWVISSFQSRSGDPTC